jgi:hypothetical protein
LDTGSWRWPIRLETGGQLEAARREGLPLPFHLPAGSTKDCGGPILNPGKGHDTVVAEAWYGGELPVYEAFVHGRPVLDRGPVGF